VCLIGYVLFNSRFLLKGPEIAIAGLDPKSEAIQSPTKDFSLQGIALHSSYISVNDRPILIDEKGHFDEKLLLSNTVNVVDIYARDKFGKEVRKKIDVVYTGNETDTIDIDQIALAVQNSSSTSVQTTEESDTPDTENNTSTLEEIETATSTESVTTN
jgi:hypothetical protein